MTNAELIKFLADRGVSVSLRLLETKRFYPRDTKLRDIYQVVIRAPAGEYTALFTDTLYHTERRLFAFKTIYGKERKDFIKGHSLGFTVAGNKKKRLVDSELRATLDRTPPLYEVLTELQITPPPNNWWEFAELCDKRDTVEYVKKEHNSRIVEYTALVSILGRTVLAELNEIKIKL